MNKFMNEYLSGKIKVLSGVAIILVLYIHSGFHDYEIEGMTLSHSVQKIISGLLGRVAVPLFYCISGYLFFQNLNSFNSVTEKIKKRLRSLVIPYFSATIFYISFYLILGVVPGVGKFINSSGKIIPNSFESLIIDIFYKNGNGSPIAFHLWFLRNLILLIILSPLLNLMFRYFSWVWIILIALLCIFIKNSLLYSLFFFCFGGSKLFLPFIVNKFDSKLIWPYIIISFYILLSVLQFFNQNLLIWSQLRVFIELFGVLVLWILFDLLVNVKFSLFKHRLLNVLFSFTFFIYLFHEPTLNVVRKFIVFILGKNQLGYLISYLLSPWIFVILFIPIGIFLKKYLSNFYSIIVGGR